MSGHRLPESVRTSFTLKGHFSVRTSFTLTEHILYDTLFEEPRKESIDGRRDPQASHLPAYRRWRISQEHLHEPEANKTLVLQMAQTVPGGRYRLVQGSGPRTPAAAPTQTSQKQQDLIIATRQRLEVEPYAQIGVTAMMAVMEPLEVLALPL